MRESLIAWHLAGADPAKLPPAEKADWNLLVVDPDSIQLYSSDVPYPIDVKPPFAIGSGEKYALGAMDGGLSPAEAVLAASKRDPYTGGNIQAIDILEALSPVVAPIAEAAE